MRKYLTIIVVIVCLSFMVLNVFAAGELFSVETYDGSSLIEIESDGQFTGWRASVEAFTTGDTLTAVETGKTCIKTGTSTGALFTLPAATVGLQFTFVDTGGAVIWIDPNGTDEINFSTGTAGTRIYSPGSSADSIHLICGVAGDWTVGSINGTWVSTP